MEPAGRTGVVRPLAAMVILAVALGYIEAAIVVYLREILAPIRQRHFPIAAREPLPLLSARHLTEADRDGLKRLLAVEVAREPAPLIVLAVCAWGFARRRGGRAGLFLVGFAVWDILYYASLKALVGWPDSLATWDILYLIPAPWVAPVWAPLAVSLTMLAAGLAAFLRAGSAAPVRRSFAAWLAVLAGAGLVLASFFTRTAEAYGAVPSRYDWPLFLAGWAFAAIGLWRLLRPAAGKL